MTSLETAGRFLARVRDEAAKGATALLAGELHSERARDIAAIAACIPESDRERLVTAMIDDFLVAFLAEVERDPTVAVHADGQSIEELTDGLTGELFGDAGWINRFSRYPSST